MASLLPRAFLLGHDPEESLLRLFRDDLAFERSLSFTSSFVVMGNVLGHSTGRDIATLCADANDYGVKRSEVWNASLREEAESSERSGKPMKFGEGPPPPELRDPERLRHTEVTTVSLIREVLWNKAGWNGTAFFLHPDSSVPPILALSFGNREAADKIFANWIDELGSRDECESLRVSIVRGISRRNPYSYRVVIGTNPSAHLFSPDKKLAVMVSRIQMMEPSSDANLLRFVEEYNRFGGYFLGYAFVQESSPYPDVAWDRLIAKKELYLRDAWEIGMNDIDVVAIHPDDDPIIPHGKTKAPVIDLLKNKRGRNAPKSSPKKKRRR